ncbi:PTS sugar transporter subunit IIA [Fusobacterium varium]|uniref:PTS sugar transporter subunit IIA n=1 Tax=Fusobacterium varium TaxID=856 RepID=UPI0027DCDA1C|nr:PTS sugar transporter subunit IIA [uncultured Fusobacterium sp.]
MKKILILTHGEWGRYLIESAKMIVGDISRIDFLPLYPQETLEEFTEKVERKVEEMKNDVIFLTDISGGTTSNVAMRIAYRNGQKVISGLSAPLLFETINILDEIDNEGVVDEVLEEARDNCKDVLKELLKTQK